METHWIQSESFPGQFESELVVNCIYCKPAKPQWTVSQWRLWAVVYGSFEFGIAGERIGFFILLSTAMVYMCFMRFKKRLNAHQSPI